jgi:cytoskeleton protein RodZ
MNDSMENLGAFLRQQREDKKVPLEEMAVRTRIAVRFIKAIEENQFDQLPNQVSAKGFLRSYARCLGLDESVVLKGFAEAVHPDQSLPAENKEEIPSYIQMKRPDRLPFPLWAALSVVGVIALLLAVTLFVPKPEEAPPISPPEAAPSLPEEMIPSELSPGLELPSGEEAVPPASSAPAPTIPAPVTTPAPPSEPAAKPLVLLVEAIESSWVQVNIDNLETKEALLQPSEKVKWEAKKKFILTVGNAGGVRVNLDGQDLGPFGPSGKVVKREITAPSAPPSISP